MASKKYAKYFSAAPIMRHLFEDGKIRPGYIFPSVMAHKGETKANFTFSFNYMTEPYKEVYPHTHEGHEMLCFVGSNPKNLNEFDAEIELCMGQEAEPQIITSPTLISIPGGVIHGPLTFKRVGKPVFFMEVCLVPEGKYGKTPEGYYDKKKPKAASPKPKSTARKPKR
jgi:hypothetical protein